LASGDPCGKIRGFEIPLLLICDDLFCAWVLDIRYIISQLCIVVKSTNLKRWKIIIQGGLYGRSI